MANKGKERRRHQRRETRVRVKLFFVGEEKRSFEATLSSVDVSVGGIFLESEFFMALGTQLQVEFELPGIRRPVVVVGKVVREQRGSSTKQGIRSGFAIQFFKFLEDAQLDLASYFLAPAIKSFIAAHRRTVRWQNVRNEEERLVDLIVAWELNRWEKGDSTGL